MAEIRGSSRPGAPCRMPGCQGFWPGVQQQAGEGSRGEPWLCWPWAGQAEAQQAGPKRWWPFWQTLRLFHEMVSVSSQMEEAVWDSEPFRLFGDHGEGVYTIKGWGIFPFYF